MIKCYKRDDTESSLLDLTSRFTRRVGVIIVHTFLPVQQSAHDRQSS